MSPLLKKLVQAAHVTLFISGRDKRLTELIVFRRNLKSIAPSVYEYFGGSINVNVGVEWLKQNLNDEEFAEYIAMKLRGLIT